MKTLDEIKEILEKAEISLQDCSEEMAISYTIDTLFCIIEYLKEKKQEAVYDW